MKWNLNNVCPQDKFEDFVEEIRRELVEIENWQKKLTPDMPTEEFEKFLKFDQKLSEKISRAAYLPELMEATNQKDSKARLWKSKINDLMLEYSQKKRKIDYWLKGLEVEGLKTLNKENSKRLFKTIPDLEYGLSHNRLAAKHTLSEKEEEIIDHKDITGSQAISDLRSLVETDLVYEFGKRKINNQAEVLKYVHSKSAKDRTMAYKALFKTHKDNIDKLFVIYQAVVKDWDYEAKLRGYTSPIGMRNFANHVPDKAVEVLLETCDEEKCLFHKYFAYKAKSMGKNKMSRTDLYAPLRGSKTKKYSFEESQKLVRDSFFKFSEKFGRLGEKVINEQHVDVYPHRGKRSGAFCATVTPQITPYVLLNHTNTLRDVSTLAHELGHAIHSLYANKHYHASQHANLPLSETASTLGEVILFEELLAKETDNKVKKQMLWEKIADSYATILRQNFFILFEIEAHEMIRKGTTADELCKAYLNNLKRQFGKGVVIEPIFKYEWLYISHIFESPFYCYAYNFGELLSLSLYSRYKSEGQGFVKKIESILETGGSKDPVKVLESVDIDMTSKDFWRGGFKIILAWQNELESIK